VCAPESEVQPAVPAGPTTGALPDEQRGCRLAPARLLATFRQRFHSATSIALDPGLRRLHQSVRRRDDLSCRVLWPGRL